MARQRAARREQVAAPTASESSARRRSRVDERLDARPAPASARPEISGQSRLAPSAAAARRCSCAACHHPPREGRTRPLAARDDSGPARRVPSPAWRSRCGTCASATATRSAVDGLSFTVAPGRVTGFVGPNGAGKSTTMRLILGLDAPDAGTRAGRRPPLRALRAPLRQVGALLDAPPRPSRPPRARPPAAGWRAATGSPARPRRRGARAGRAERASRGRRVGGFSLGMRQRLGHRRRAARRPAACCCSTSRSTASTPRASAGSAASCATLAAEGRTVLVSSHLMSELRGHRRPPARDRPRPADRRRAGRRPAGGGASASRCARRSRGALMTAARRGGRDRVESSGRRPPQP